MEHSVIIDTECTLHLSSNNLGLCIQGDNNKQSLRKNLLPTLLYYFTNVTDFTEEDSGHICGKFCCNIWFYFKITSV